METKNLLCKSISWPKATSERSFDKDFASMLANAIREEGQSNAIMVRPDPDKPNHFIGVQGKHRWYAIHKVLRQDLIEAKVAVGMDEKEADLYTTSENLWRNELTKSQRVKAIKKWQEYYDAKRAAKEAEAQAKLAQRAEQGQLTEADVASEAAKAEEKEATFTEQVAAATGQSERTAKRTIRLAKTFDDEQLEVFEQMGTSQDDMTAVAQVKDSAQRAEIVTLIASGLDPRAAITKITGNAAPVGDGSKSRAESKAAAKQEAQPELTDDEWFAESCGEKAALLANPAQYKADAILYRQLGKLRHEFRSKAKAKAKATKDSGVFGNFFYLVRRFVNLSHPKDWLLCDQCTGKGVKADGVKCGKCAGSGVLLSVEDYI